MISLPRTLGDFLSPEGQAAIARAEEILNACERIEIVIVTTDGKEHKGVVALGKNAAVARIKL